MRSYSLATTAAIWALACPTLSAAQGVSGAEQQDPTAVEQTATQTLEQIRRAHADLRRVLKELQRAEGREALEQTRNNLRQALRDIDQILEQAHQGAERPGAYEAALQRVEAARRTVHQSGDPQEWRAGLQSVAAALDPLTSDGRAVGAEVIVEPANPEVLVEMTPPEVIVETAPPQVTVQQTEPEITVIQREPEVTVRQAEPEVIIERAEPEVVVQQPEPDVTIAEPTLREELKTAAVESIDAGRLIGREAETVGGKGLGEIEQIILAANGTVEAVILEVGGFLGIGERELAIPWDRLRLAPEGDRIVVDLTEAEIEAMPAYRP